MIDGMTLNAVSYFEAKCRYPFYAQNKTNFYVASIDKYPKM